ncbi:Os02g0293050, partial [Oryza sativa Japonica Group]
EHGDGPEEPEEDRAGEVEGARAERPEVAAAVERRGDVVDGEARAAAALDQAHRHVHEGAGVAVVPDGLHVQEERHQEAHQDGEEFHRQRRLARGAHHQRRAREEPIAAAAAGGGHEDGDEGAERDGRGRQQRRRHDVVPDRLHRQHRVLPRRLLYPPEPRHSGDLILISLATKTRSSVRTNLHDVADPDAAVDGVDADDGGRRAAADAEEQPCVVPHHERHPQRDQHVVQLLLPHRSPHARLTA